MYKPKKIKTGWDVRYFFIAVFIGIIILAFFIILPFLISILTSIILAYIFYPVHKRIEAKVRFKSLAAFLSVLLVILIITLPMLFVLNTISREVVNIYATSMNKILSGNLAGVDCDNEGFVCKASNFFHYVITNPQVKQHIDESIKSLRDNVLGSVYSFLLTTPKMLVNFFITIFTLFYLFMDGEKIVQRISKILPIKGTHQKKILKKFDDMIYAVVYGQILVAIAQGALGVLGFYIFGISSPITWGIMIMFASFIPYFGTAIIWVPAGIMSLAIGEYFGGVGILLWGLLLIGTVDNILKPKIIGDRGGLHPILVLLGVLGGLKFFGFIGIVLGPIILALVAAFAKIYEEER